ncbi:MAG: stage III sporulation protein AG [Clostridiales bacterium]|nr:stage III sporulation protein AG [Clostridiales bacterium]
MEEKKEKNSLNLRSIFGLDKSSRHDNDKQTENSGNSGNSGKDESDLDEKKGKTSIIKSIGPSNIVIILMVGILLLILSWPNSSSSGKDNKNTNESKETNKSKEEISISISNSDTEIYVHTLEQRLEEALRKVEGVGEVEVMITLKGSKEVVVLKDQPFNMERVDEDDGEGGKRITSNHDQEENTILIENKDGSKTPYVLKELEPQVEGILVIATGGNNAEIINQINEAVQVLFGVPAHKVKVMKMN